MKLKYKYFEKLDGWKRMSWWQKLSYLIEKLFIGIPSEEFKLFLHGFRKAPHKNKLQEENKNDT